MPSFKIDDTIFNFEIDMKDELNIKSKNKDYSVTYCNCNYNINKNDVVFIDNNVYNLYPNILSNNIYKFDATENNKNINSVLDFINYLMEINFTKNNNIIVIGGGITQEVGGFAAAIYKRGVSWYYIPTTILAMTDSCIGSKVSLNHISKNILGMMEAPNKVFISESFLKTLNEDDILSGIGEALKLSLIGNIFDLFMEKYNNKNYIDLIKIASLVKKEVIEFDEFEKHHRKVLNYGHTFGHALEAVTNYYIPHGIGVMFGMVIENNIIQKHEDINQLILNMIPKKYFDIGFNF
jgi:3-dehydroquinate synthase